MYCKNCGKEIPKGSKFCLECGAPIEPADVPAANRNTAEICLKIATVIFAIIFVFSAAFLIHSLVSTSGGKSHNVQASAQKKVEPTEANGKSAAPAEPSPLEMKLSAAAPAEYEVVDVGYMVDLLNNNAMKANSLYDEKWVEITGKLSVIDSSGKYISIRPDDDFAFIGVLCNIKNEEQKQAVMNMNINDIITVRGQVKEVGEVIGYSLDIEEFVY